MCLCVRAYVCARVHNYMCLSTIIVFIGNEKQGGKLLVEHKLVARVVPSNLNTSNLPYIRVLHVLCVLEVSVHAAIDDAYIHELV